jgi:hypothetical protein
MVVVKHGRKMQLVPCGVSVETVADIQSGRTETATIEDCIMLMNDPGMQTKMKNGDAPAW